MDLTQQEQMLIKEFSNQAEEKMKGLINGTATKQEVADAVKQMSESVKTETEAVKTALETILKEQGLTIENLQKNFGNDSRPLSWQEQVKNALTENKDRLTNYKGGTAAKFEVSKAAAMTTGNYSGGFVGITTWDNEPSRFVRRKPYLRDLIRVRNVSDAYVAWMEQSNAGGGAGNQTEGSAKTQADFDLVEASMKIQTINSYINASKQMLADIPFINSLINDELMELVDLRLDSQILTGSGLTTNLKGIVEYATAYSAGAFASTITNSNIFDLLVTAKAQIAAANASASVVLMHPTDVARFILTKDNDSNYIQGPGGLLTASGLQIVENTGVSQNTLYVMDALKSTLALREDVSVTIGLNSDDFTTNKVTILAEMRAAHYIKSNDTTAFVKVTDIDAAVATLNV